MKHWDKLTIDNFSGPLDILWNMIKDKKIDIQQVQLIDIVDQYLSYINSQQKLDIEIASEYLVMASQLIELKSRKLLPEQNQVTDEDDLQFDDLIEQITQYGQIKELTNFFYNKQEEYLTSFSKPKSKQSFNKLLKKDDEEDIDILNIDLEEFVNIFKNAMERRQQEDVLNDEGFWDEEDGYDPNHQEIISPQIIAKSIVSRMKTNKRKSWKLEEVIIDYEVSLMNIISTFLAILDLVRHQLATINQKEETLEFTFTESVIEDETLLKVIEEAVSDEQ
ncbi:segregation and condensation protein A [Entomoplasma ellychniae]|uniref:Segregation and condensation protein A n=1 Tax=Entomoplasma ellychniae TaxID=2114 RepID=A0A8E2UE18_9MOLU|nr:segregation/condensation protein A [Entomoplasma ellychniae]PPE04653.1 segregation and condensation protein A [Entomoplasma ellychniae]